MVLSGCIWLYLVVSVCICLYLVVSGRICLYLSFSTTVDTHWFEILDFSLNAYLVYNFKSIAPIKPIEKVWKWFQCYIVQSKQKMIWPNKDAHASKKKKVHYTMRSKPILSHTYIFGISIPLFLYSSISILCTYLWRFEIF